MFFIGTIYFTGGTVSTLAIIQAVLLTVPYCFVVFGVNDVYDYETDKNNPRKGGYEGVILEKKYHRSVLGLAHIFMALLLLSSLLTMNIMNIASMCGLVFLAYTYSAPPRFKAIPVFDAFVNGLGVFFVLTLALSFTSQQIPYYIYYIAIGIIAAHLLSQLPDYTNDKQAKITTSAIVLGRRTVAAIATLLLVHALFFSGIELIHARIVLAIGILCGIVVLIKPRIALLTMKLLYTSAIVVGLALIIQLLVV